jgi:hypothetical protein
LNVKQVVLIVDLFGKTPTLAKSPVRFSVPPKSNSCDSLRDVGVRENEWQAAPAGFLDFVLGDTCRLFVTSDEGQRSRKNVEKAGSNEWIDSMANELSCRYRLFQRRWDTTHSDTDDEPCVR